MRKHAVVSQAERVHSVHWSVARKPVKIFFSSGVKRLRPEKEAIRRGFVDGVSAHPPLEAGAVISVA